MYIFYKYFIELYNLIKSCARKDVNKLSGKSKRSQLSKEDLEVQTIEEQRRNRLNMHYTRENLAEKSHITASHLYQLEIGNSTPSIITIIDICNALNISIAQLTNNLLNDSINKFSELIANNYNNLSDSNKQVIIQLINIMSSTP